MSETLDLGRRIELHSMDVHCRNISLGLYRRDVGDVPRVLVHTYSAAEGAGERVAFITRALIVMLGMEDVPDDPGWIRFPCQAMHEHALKRAFLDLCKLETDAPLAPKPLTIFDKKADGNLIARSLGDGVYEMGSDADTSAGARRVKALARGYAKLCEMDIADGADNRVAFGCRTSHDAMIGMLMYRAQNVRSAMQENEMAAARGVLSAPSQQ